MWAKQKRWLWNLSRVEANYNPSVCWILIETFRIAEAPRLRHDFPHPVTEENKATASSHMAYS